MAYGLSTRAFIGSGAAEQAATARDATCADRPWRALSETCRLAVVERALRPANENIDGFPAAL